MNIIKIYNLTFSKLIKVFFSLRFDCLYHCLCIYDNFTSKTQMRVNIWHLSFLVWVYSYNLSQYDFFIFCTFSSDFHVFIFSNIKFYCLFGNFTKSIPIPITSHSSQVYLPPLSLSSQYTQCIL